MNTWRAVETGSGSAAGDGVASSRSILLPTKMMRLPRHEGESTPRLGSGPSRASKSSIATSQRAMSSCALRTASASTAPSGRRMPAESISSNGTPRMETTSLTTSLVVPGCSCTITRSLRSRAFSSVDLPTLGGPTMAAFGGSSSAVPSAAVPSRLSSFERAAESSPRERASRIASSSAARAPAAWWSSILTARRVRACGSRRIALRRTSV